MAIVETRVTLVAPGTFNRPIPEVIHRYDLIVQGRQIPIMPPGWVPLSQRKVKHLAARALSRGVG